MELLGRALNRWGRISFFSICFCLLLCSGSLCLTVQAKETYPIVHDVDASDRSAYIEIKDAAGTYEVLPGDCLWAIADKLWGDGSRYTDIVEANKETIRNPNLIYPGTLLQVGQIGYIRKDKNSGIGMGEYRFRTPETWRLVYLQEGSQSANFALAGDGLCHIACLIRDKEETTVETVQDWDACCDLIKEYAHSQYGDAISDLNFEHYRTGESDELYLYSYIYEADLTEFGINSGGYINVCAGLKLTEHIQAEFIGFAYDYDIHGAVRYVTADFEELLASTGYSSINGSNMSISPVYSWEPEGLFNPFPWVEGFVDDVFRRLTDTPPKNQNKKDELLDEMRTPKER